MSVSRWRQSAVLAERVEGDVVGPGDVRGLELSWSADVEHAECFVGGQACLRDPRVEPTWL